MIRFVWLGSQINEDASEFAFYDTVNDKFMCFAGEQVFDNLDDFRACCIDKIVEARCVELVLANHPTKYFTRRETLSPEMESQYLHDPQKGTQE